MRALGLRNEWKRSAELFELAALILRPVPRTHPDEWGRDNRVYPPSAGIPGPRDPLLTPYMIAFGRAIASGLYKRVVGVVGAQMGKTDTYLDVIGSRLDQRPAPLLYVGPGKEFLTDQFEPRLMGLLDQAPVLARKVIRGRRMKKTLKIVAGVPLRLAHAGSSMALKSDPAALALVDEYDEMLANIRGQGDPLGLIEARGFTYADFVTAITSTPSQGMADTEVDPVSKLEFWKPGDPDQVTSPIWKLFQEGTRYHWAWPCPHCGEYFIPRFKHLSWPKNSTPAQARRGAFLCCPVNGCVITNDAKTKMNERGVFVAPGQSVDKEGVVTGDPPDSSTWSMWTSGLASPFVPWGDRAEDYLNAEISGEEDKKQTAINAGFGEMYVLGGGGDVPEWQEVKAKRMPYRTGEVPLQVLRVVAGVDVQKRSLLYSIRGYGGRGTSYLLDYGQIFGATDIDDPWDELWAVLQQTFDGLPIEKAFIDSGFRPDKPDAGDEHRVYAFCRLYPWVCYPTKGRAVMQGATVKESTVDFVDKRGKRKALPLMLINTDHFKSIVHSKVRTAIDRPGSFLLPDDIDDDYCKQVVSEARIVVDGKPTWLRRQKDNHFLDTEALCEAAMSTLRPRVVLIPEGIERGQPLPPSALRSEGANGNTPPDDGDDMSAPAPTSETEPDVAPQVAAAALPAKASFRDRFANLSGRFNKGEARR